jgi:predicted phosphoadenosine phosphosulfate sulfurtransferase
VAGMEFEEFIVLFGEWYGQGDLTAAFIGIRAQESLHRYCAIATWEKRNKTFNGRRWTTNIIDNVFNVYPIYDWLTEDIWRFHACHPDRPAQRHLRQDAPGWRQAIAAAAMPAVRR